MRVFRSGDMVSTTSDAQLAAPARISSESHAHCEARSLHIDAANNQENHVMSSRAIDSFQSIDITLLDAVTGGGDINWGNAAAQAGIWGLAGGATAAVTGVGAPLAWAAAGVGAAAGFGSAVVSDLLN